MPPAVSIVLHFCPFTPYMTTLPLRLYHVYTSFALQHTYTISTLRHTYTIPFLHFNSQIHFSAQPNSQVHFLTTITNYRARDLSRRGWSPTKDPETCLTRRSPGDRAIFKPYSNCIQTIFKPYSNNTYGLVRLVCLKPYFTVWLKPLKIFIVKSCRKQLRGNNTACP